MDISSSIKNIPFIQITPLVILGVVSAVEFDFLANFWVLFFCFLFGVVSYLKFPQLRFICYFLFGASLVWLHSSDEIPLLKNTKGVFVAEQKMDKISYVCEIVEVDSIMSSEKVVLVKDKRTTKKITVGDTIIANVNFDLVKDSRLPDKNEYVYNNIKYFSKIDSITIIDAPEVVRSQTIFQKIKLVISQRIDLLDCSDDWKGLLSAMVIGDKRDVSYQSYTLFLECGLSHFLAISGWHVGVLFLFLNALLFPLGYVRYGKYPKSIFILFLIWSYAALVGFSPSICRAALMFTFFQYALFAKISRRTKYNIIFASLFLFICYDYNYVFDVGLQLSYTAILSIHLFFNRIYRLFSPFRHVTVNWLISTITLVLSVQILILPVLLFYFGATSPISILANLSLSLPFSILIIAATTFIIFPNPLSGKVVVVATELIDTLLNEFVSWEISMTGYYLTPLEVVIYFLTVLFLIQIFEKE